MKRNISDSDAQHCTIKVLIMMVEDRRRKYEVGISHANH